MSPNAAVRLADLGPQRDRVLVLQAICPPHPDGNGKVLRAGCDPRGHYWQFELKNSTAGKTEWVKYRLCTDEEIETIFTFYGKRAEDCQIRHRQGPSGCEMLFHVSEPY